MISILNNSINIMQSSQAILNTINKCYLPKLSRNLEEIEDHTEFQQWEKNLTTNIPNLFVLINDINLKECRMSSTILSSLLILNNELVSEGPWKSEKCNEYLAKLNQQFNLIHKTTLFNLLISKVFNTQEIFDKTMETLHQKLTVDEFKMYPALIEVYFLIIKNIMEYDIELTPRSVMPISLLLIDDYVTDNKAKGLQCCSTILECLTLEHFNKGNYYEVIYGVVKRPIAEKDLKVTQLILECFLHLFNIMPEMEKITVMDDAFKLIIKQAYTESNLYKKKVFFGFLDKLIHVHGINCIKRKLFLTLISDNLDICSNKPVASILLLDTLECLESWIQYCWCAWRLHPNQKILSTLIKLLYIYCDDEKLCTKMKNICIAIIQLCSIEEQQQIYKSLKNTVENLNHLNSCFLENLNNIRNDLCDCVKE